MLQSNETCGQVFHCFVKLILIVPFSETIFLPKLFFGEQSSNKKNQIFTFLILFGDMLVKNKFTLYENYICLYRVANFRQVFHTNYCATNRFTYSKRLDQTQKTNWIILLTTQLNFFQSNNKLENIWEKCWNIIYSHFSLKRSTIRLKAEYGWRSWTSGF